MLRLIFSFIMIFASLAQCGVAYAMQGDSKAVQKVELAGVEAAIYSALRDDRGLEKDLFDYGIIKTFYTARNFKPLWVQDDGLSRWGEDLLAEVSQSWTHGLNPYTYRLQDINRILNADDFKMRLPEMELLLTDSYVRLARDLSGIRVNPATLDTSKSFWKQAQSAENILLKLMHGGSFDAILNSFVPQGKTYQRLREELRDVIARPAPDYEGVLPIRCEGLLKPYARQQCVIDLRVRLGLDRSVKEPAYYGDDLGAAIIRFQREHGLKPDGLIGGQTLDILNITRVDKIHTLIANLERLRWVEDEKPDKFVVVNIPSAMLWAVENDKLAFDMQVIVGRSQRPTNMFVTEIDGVRFNPTWTVPKTIKREDILPELRKDPEYLQNKGMELLLSEEGENVTIDPLSIDWTSVSEEDIQQFRMVQTPGDHNPLGRVRVLMPNRYNVYLHDTNKKEYFSRASRAISSGCVRMREPEKMADFIMKERSSWSRDDMDGLFAQGEMRDLYLKKPIPVYLLYYTVWVNEYDEVVYGRDLYNYDKKLVELLKNIDGILIPVDNNGNNRGYGS